MQHTSLWENKHNRPKFMLHVYYEITNVCKHECDTDE